MFNTIKWTFAVGHVFNDLCASMWFLFTMPYFTKVLAMPNVFAGDVILIGQVADAIATPLIGIGSDKFGILCHKTIGQRKSWHLLGTILCAISFPFIFNPLCHVTRSDQLCLVIYYSPFVILFQIAWAIVQITHLSMIPVLMKLGQDNSSLNSLRYMFTVAANVIVLTTTTILFQVNKLEPQIQNHSTTDSSNVVPSSISLNPSDWLTFTYLTIGVVVLGLLFSFMYHVGVPEKLIFESLDINSVASGSNSDSCTPLLLSSKFNMGIRDWFKEPKFYIINFLYLCTRLIVNVSQVYLIVYVVDSLLMSKIQSSLAALTTFISGAIASLIMKKMQNLIGKKVCYLLGLVFIGSFCGVVSASSPDSPVWQMYMSMSLLGIGCSLIMIGSLSLTADLIGKSCSSSAFVYGCMSFSDKMFSGIVIWVMQRLGPKTENCFACNSYYHEIEMYFIGGCTALAFVILLILFPMKIDLRWKDRNLQRLNSDSNFNSNIVQSCED